MIPSRSWSGVIRAVSVIADRPARCPAHDVAGEFGRLTVGEEALWLVWRRRGLAAHRRESRP